MLLLLAGLEPLGPGQVRYRVHGPLTTNGGEVRVPGAVFAAKLATLVRALKSADRIANGGKVLHEYTIAHLETSSPQVILAEEPLRPIHPALYSGVTAFDECARAVHAGDTMTARRFGTCPHLIGRLAKGASQQFGYAELWIADHEPLRVDSMLAEQAQSITGEHGGAQFPGTTQEWFKGVAHGSFDGQIKEVDLRGALPQLKLVLTAGAKEIDCTFRIGDMELIRANLDRRVSVEGRAIYDGKSGLPRRVEIATVRPVGVARDFARWKGAFEPFIPEWDDDEL